MKRTAVIIAAFALQFAIAPRARSAETEISFDYFYDSLQPAGEWSYSDDYGYCWSPQAAREEAWRPYTDVLGVDRQRLDVGFQRGLWLDYIPLRPLGAAKRPLVVGAWI